MGGRGDCKGVQVFTTLGRRNWVVMPTLGRQASIEIMPTQGRQASIEIMPTQGRQASVEIMPTQGRQVGNRPRGVNIGIRLSRSLCPLAHGMVTGILAGLRRRRFF